MTETRSSTLHFSEPQRAQDGSSWRSGSIDNNAATVTSVQMIQNAENQKNIVIEWLDTDFSHTEISVSIFSLSFLSFLFSFS